MGSSTKNQKVRSDNRRMTGNVNIYICSEAVEKNEKNAEENVTQTTATSGSTTSLISEKSRQKVGPIEEHLASPNRVRKKLAAKPSEKQHNDNTVKKDAAKDSDIIDHEKLISTTEFNKFTSYESKSNPTAGENILKNSNEPREHKINSDSTRYDRSKLVSCRCPQFDESDLWLQKALKRQNRDSTVMAPSYNVKKADPNEQRFADAQKNLGKSEKMDKMCTCDRNEKHDSKANGACDQLCTCCCIDVHKKENVNGSKSKKIDKKQTSEFKKETSKSSHDKKESSLRKKDEKIAENQTQLKVTNSKDDSKDNSKDPKENLKTKKSNSSEKIKSIDKVVKEDKSNDSKKSSKERLQPIESESNKTSKKDLENVQKPQKKSKLSIKEKTNKEKSTAKEKPQEVKLQSKEKKKITKEKKSTKTKEKLAIKENSENKSSEPRKSDKVDAPDSVKTKKKKEKKTKLVLTDTNEKSTHRKAINDQKEDSIFSKLINIMKSNKKVSRTDVKKRGCSPDCTGLTKATDTSIKNKSKREKIGQKPKPSSGTIISNGSHNISEKFHDSKSASDTQVNDTVDLNSHAKSEDEEKSTPLLDKTDDTVDKTFGHSEAEDKNEQFRYYDNRVGRYPEITKIKTKDNDEPYSRLEKNCSCYDCLRESEAACDQFSFSNSYPHETYFEKSIESCCACQLQRPVMNFKEDQRRCFDDLQEYPLVATNKLRRGTESAHCCWCSCRDSA